MDEFVKKAKNYFIIGKIAEKLLMYSESASNYFKSLAAINDYMLGRLNLKAKNHTERFLLLKDNFPELHKITDKLFTIYRRTYNEELEKDEINILRKSIEEAFSHAGIDIPRDKEIESKTKKFLEK